MSQEVEKVEESVEVPTLEYLEGVDIPALFSAEMPEETVRFTIGGAPCEVTLKPMTADALARWQDANAKSTMVRGDDGKDVRFLIEPSSADGDVKLLVGSVTGFQAYTKNEILEDGKPTGEYQKMQIAFPRDERGRTDFFKRMHPELRRRLVNEAKRVNGLNPLESK
jgi:hypothetical protein